MGLLLRMACWDLGIQGPKGKTGALLANDTSSNDLKVFVSGIAFQ